MALKGVEAKQAVAQKILDTFEGAFFYNDGKEIRIPMKENGEFLQVKCVLTAAKVAVSPDGENAMPGEAKPADWNFEAPTAQAATPPPQPSKEEAENIENLLKSFGF